MDMDHYIPADDILTVTSTSKGKPALGNDDFIYIQKKKRKGCLIYLCAKVHYPCNVRIWVDVNPDREHTLSRRLNFFHHGAPEKIALGN